MTVIDLMLSPAMFKPSNDASTSLRPFFAQDPIKVLEESQMLDVPVMIGFNKEDGIITSAGFLETPAKFENMM